MILRGIDRSGSIRDDDIHAYADGLLDAARRRQVERHLAIQPGDAERVAAYRRINADLADLGISARDRDTPARFAALAEDLGEALVRQRQVRRTAGGAFASLLLLAAASGTWMLAETGPKAGNGGMKVAAVESAFPEGLAEISADSKDEVVTWLSQRVDPERFSTPDLNFAGFTLSGARVVPTSDGPLVQILYRDDSKTALTFSVFGGDMERGRKNLAELSERQMAVYWRQGSLVYSLVGPMRHSDLTMLADLVAGETKSTSASEKPSQPVAIASDKSGLLLIDSKTETAAAAPSSSGKAEEASPADDSVKAPPTTAEKIEEPKPL